MVEMASGKIQVNFRHLRVSFKTPLSATHLQINFIKYRFMLPLRSLWASLIALSTLCAAASSSGSRVLVVLEPALAKDSFSTFFNGLEGEFVVYSMPQLFLTPRRWQREDTN